MTRSEAISHAEQHFGSGEFQRTLARRIAVPTESQNPERRQAQANYLDSELRPAFKAMGFDCQTLVPPRFCARACASWRASTGILVPARHRQRRNEMKVNS